MPVLTARAVKSTFCHGTTGPGTFEEIDTPGVIHGSTVICISLLVSVYGLPHFSGSVISQLILSLLLMPVIVYDTPAPAVILFFNHLYIGDALVLAGKAVNVTGVPGQILSLGEDNIVTKGTGFITALVVPAAERQPLRFAITA